jgi:hypothetical protein
MFAWKDTILPLQYASKFTVLAGYFEVAHSPTFYVTLVFLAGRLRLGARNAGSPPRGPSALLCPLRGNPSLVLPWLLPPLP